MKEAQSSQVVFGTCNHYFTAYRMFRQLDKKVISKGALVFGSHFCFTPKIKTFCCWLGLRCGGYFGPSVLGAPAEQLRWPLF